MTDAERNQLLALKHRVTAAEDKNTDLEKRLCALESADRARLAQRELDEMGGLKNS